MTESKGKETEAKTKQGDRITPSKSSIQDAFSALMAPKPKAPPAPNPSPFVGRSWRHGLGVYLENPKSHPAVIYYNDDVVAIYDMFPKSSIHALLLPRSEQHMLQSPFEAFKDPEFLKMVIRETAKLKTFVAEELKRRYGSSSALETERQAIVSGKKKLPPGATEIPEGKDWEAHVNVGIHAKPSMAHIHVHVFSRDMHSPCVRHKEHYNSFNTPFLINPSDFPLALDDPRLYPKLPGHLADNMVCWRCGEDFGNQFTKLQEHLAREFDEWRKE